MTGQHTPGPWVRGRYNDLLGAGGRKVLFRAMALLCAGHEDTLAEAEANTRLADAAPELLEELRNARSILVDLEDWPVTSPNVVSIDAAIAKAEGRT